ncbi:type 1 fimbria pilin [Erwinia toletana]|uniref:Type 1 fimbria pilin n=1 Tax=Winslowiella toletana TaxID=92490 RepID=A0ABS4P9G1_9GAMM|nr:fimbrial protein [Winslowiella toletana]MBP2169257.1 type 1 fimbria pilin [Winslowiella toletana]
MKLTQYRLGCWTLLLCITLIQSATHAESVAVNFRGTLIEPPACTINGGQRIDIEFGNVRDELIDGQNYIQAINYQLNCPDAPAPLILTLSIQGGLAEFDPTAVNTNLRELGIRVLHDGIPLEINTPIMLDITRPPLLQAVPVKRNGTTLSPGRFAAVATLYAGYL